MPPACHTSPSYSPLLRPPVFGWLLHGCLLIGGRLKATVYFIKKIRPSICCSKQYSHVPPRAPQPVCLLICCRSQLLVDCCVSLLIGGQGQGPAFHSFFDGACIGSPNKGTNHGADKPNCTHLEPAYGKRQSHELTALLPFPWSRCRTFGALGQLPLK